MLVVDASAVIEVLLDRPAADEIARRMAEQRFDLHAPHLLDIEVLSALRRLVLAGEASAERAHGAVSDLLDLPIERYPHDVLLSRAWEMRDNLTAYDAVYVSLAEVLGDLPVPLLTTDGRLARAVPGYSDVEVILAV